MQVPAEWIPHKTGAATRAELPLQFACSVVEVAAARLAKLQAKGRRILMQPQVKALNKWRAEAITYRKMLGIVHRMMNRQKSRAFEAWQALAEELRANGERMRGIMNAMSPEGRKKRAALNKLIAVYEQVRVLPEP